LVSRWFSKYDVQVSAESHSLLARRIVGALKNAINNNERKKRLMKTQRHLLTVIAVVAIVTLVCLGRLASAQRGKAFVSRTADANAQATETFSPKDHVIYCIVENAKPNTTYKFVWGRYEPPKTTPQTIFQEEQTNGTGNRVVSKFSSPDDLPAGDYSVNVWEGGHMREIFAVKE